MHHLNKITAPEARFRASDNPLQTPSALDITAKKETEMPDNFSYPRTTRTPIAHGVNGPRIDQQQVDREHKAAKLPDSILDDNLEVQGLRARVADRERRHKHVSALGVGTRLNERESELRTTIEEMRANLVEAALDIVFDDDEIYLEIREKIRRTELLLDAVLMAKSQIPEREPMESKTGTRLRESQNELQTLAKRLKLEHLMVTEHRHD